MSKTNKKIYVLDTSVLLFDNTSIFKFEDNDLVIPIPVLEELDTKKVGNESINYHARQLIRNLEKMFEESGKTSWSPILPPLNSLDDNLGNIEVEFIEDKTSDSVDKTKSVCEIFNKYSNDNKIVECALKYQRLYPSREVILVSKDVNLRLKGKSLGVKSENFLNSGITMSQDEEYEAVIKVENQDIFSDLYKTKLKGSCDASKVLEDTSKLIHNSYYELDGDTRTALVRYDKKLDVFNRVNSKYAFNVTGRNKEQKFALDALLDPEIHLVILEGISGCGKTLLTIASALEQKSDYQKIVLSKPTIATSKEQDVGFLPGELEAKLAPWMQSYMDNFDLIKELANEKKPKSGTDKKSSTERNSKKSNMIDAMLETGKVSMAALAFLRGRSLNSSFFVIDEAQNLTPHEVKTIVTRAGMGTKIVFMGDINQIDNTYLDKKSNGLSYLKHKLRGQDIVAHVKLEKGERSPLANLANELL